MALLRHGGMGKLFTNAYAPSTLGSFLRSFTFGHVRQLDAVASRFLTRLADQAPMILGKYCLSRPLVFSFVGRCHGECGSAKNTFVPVS